MEPDKLEKLVSDIIDIGKGLEAMKDMSGPEVEIHQINGILKLQTAIDSAVKEVCADCGDSGKGKLIRRCPKCGSSGISTERQIDGNSVCMNCNYKDKTQKFDIYPPCHCQDQPKSEVPEADKDIKSILSKWLTDHGYDGIYSPDGECGCFVDDGLEPCECNMWDCFPGYKVWCTDKDEEYFGYPMICQSKPHAIWKQFGPIKEPGGE